MPDQRVPRPTTTRSLGALQAQSALTLTDEQWELHFAFGEPVELGVDFDGVGEPALEVEVELPGRSDESGPDVQ